MPNKVVTLLLNSNNMSVFHGIAVYKIIFEDGKVNLSGIYTNTWLFTKPNIIDIEIASKDMGSNSFIGDYDCTFTHIVENFVEDKYGNLIDRVPQERYRFTQVLVKQ